MAKKLTSKKAREILHDKSVHGKPLTDKQRRFFGAISSGKSNWLKKYQDAGETLPPYPVPRSSYMPNPYSNEFYKKRMDESLASSQDFLRKWYEGRKTLPEFKDVSERRLKLLDRPINIEYEDYETQKQKSSAAAYNPNDQTLILTDLSKPYNPGYPAYQDLDDYNYKVSTSTGAPVMVHEVAHKLQYEAPQQGYRSYMPPGPLIPSRKEFASPKNSGLDKDQYRYLSSRDVALSKRLNRSAPFPADKASVFHPELESGVAMLRMAENMDPTKKYTAEDLIPIINKYAQEPTEEKETPYTPEEATQEHNKWFINDMFRLFGNDPEKIAKYINSVARNERKPSNIAQQGGDISIPNVYPNAMVPKLQYGSVIEDDMGQWKYPGQVTRINSNQITMQGVPYPVLGISDTGDKQMMYPNQEYNFKGKSVTEYPMMQKGGLKKSYNPNLASKDADFQNWYKQNTLEGQRGIPYGKNLDYDYYSFYRNEDYKDPRFSVENHFPDTYKRPNHETFSNESIYSTPENPGGSWNGEKYNPKGRWLNKYQYAGIANPRDLVRPAASESTSITYNTRKGPVSTATTGMSKQDMKENAISQSRARQSEEKQKQARIAERKAASNTRANNVPFTLPTGETKKYEDMNWREKFYTAGKNLGQMGRINKDDEAWYDEYFNPLSIVGSMAEGLGTVPYVAKQTNSNLPYLTGIAAPVLTGAFASIGANNTKQFLNNAFNPAAGIGSKSSKNQASSNVIRDVGEYKGKKPINPIHDVKEIGPYFVKKFEGAALDRTYRRNLQKKLFNLSDKLEEAQLEPWKFPANETKRIEKEISELRRNINLTTDFEPRSLIKGQEVYPDRILFEGIDLHPIGLKDFANSESRSYVDEALREGFSKSEMAKFKNYDEFLEDAKKKIGKGFQNTYSEPVKSKNLYFGPTENKYGGWLDNYQSGGQTIDRLVQTFTTIVVPKRKPKKRQVKKQQKPKEIEVVVPETKQVEAPQPVIPQIDYSQGTPIYAPVPTGGGGAFVGFKDKSGKITYVQPEDYQRMGVPGYGKEYIKNAQKQKYGGWLKKYK